MKTRSRYKLILEDESRLENVISYSASPRKWILLLACGSLMFMIIGALIVGLTPLRSFLPGYLKESERAATQVQLMRLDSLQQAYDTNIAFIKNLHSVLNPVEGRKDSLSFSTLKTPLSSDSILPTSPEEERFVSMMRERERYNISVVAPLAAESLLFSSLNDESVFSEASKRSVKGEIIMAKGAPVAAIGDGTVIAISQSMRDGGASVIIQHHKGFLSRCSRLGNVLVEVGDVVTGGQIIALANHGNARKGEIINIEMWHNGNQLVPFEYIGDDLSPLNRRADLDADSGGF